MQCCALYIEYVPTESLIALSNPPSICYYGIFIPISELLRYQPINPANMRSSIHPPSSADADTAADGMDGENSSHKGWPYRYHPLSIEAITISGVVRGKGPITIHHSNSIEGFTDFCQRGEDDQPNPFVDSSIHSGLIMQQVERSGQVSVFLEGPPARRKVYQVRML